MPTPAQQQQQEQQQQEQQRQLRRPGLAQQWSSAGSSTRGFETGRGGSPDVEHRAKRNSSLSTYSLAGLQRQQSYRHNPCATHSNLSVAGRRAGAGGYPGNVYPGNGGGDSGVGQFAVAAEAAANESRWAISQRNAQQSNNLLARKLYLVSLRFHGQR